MFWIITVVVMPCCVFSVTEKVQSQMEAAKTEKILDEVVCYFLNA